MEVIQKLSTPQLHNHMWQASRCHICYCFIDYGRRWLGIFHSKTVFSRAEKFSLVSRHNWAKFGIHPKNGSEVKASNPNECSLFYYIREDESKAFTPPQRKCYSKCKQKITRNKIYFGNEIVEQVSCSSNSSDLVHFTPLIWVRYQLGVTIFR